MQLSINTIYYYVVFKIEYIQHQFPVRVPFKVVKANPFNELDKTYEREIKPLYNMGINLEVILVAQTPKPPFLEGVE